MDSTSNRTHIDLTSNGEDIDFTGWQLLDNTVYELWLSPCKTWLVQWYNWHGQPHWRNRRTAFERDANIMEQYFNGRQLRWCPRVRGFKNWDFQIIHDFTGCTWLGTESTPDAVIPEILADLREHELNWPTLSNRHLYRTQEGLTAAFGAYLCFEDSAQPVNLNFWGDLLTDTERQAVQQFPLEQGRVDWRLWMQKVIDTNQKNL